MKRILLILLFIIFNSSYLYLQENPFLRKNTDTNQIIKEKKAKRDYITRNLLVIQKELNRSLSEKLEEIKTEKSVLSLIIILIISFVYGIIHAIGPGHGKTVITSYFLSEKSKKRESILSGLIIAITHTLVSIIIMFIFILFLKGLNLYFDSISRITKKISYFLIILIGIYMLYEKIRNIKDEKVNENTKSLISLSLSIGLVPCPMVFTVLLFAYSLDLIGVGILSAIFMGLGMAFTISVIGLGVIVSKNIISLMDKNKTGAFFIITKALGIIGSILVILIGLLFFILEF